MTVAWLLRKWNFVWKQMLRHVVRIHDTFSRSRSKYLVVCWLTNLHRLRGLVIRSCFCNWGFIMDAKIYYKWKYTIIDTLRLVRNIQSWFALTVLQDKPVHRTYIKYVTMRKLKKNNIHSTVKKIRGSPVRVISSAVESFLSLPRGYRWRHEVLHTIVLQLTNVYPLVHLSGRMLEAVLL